MKRYRLEITDGDSGHGWEVVDKCDDPVFIGYQAGQIVAKDEYRSSGGVRIVEQAIVLERHRGR